MPSSKTGGSTSTTGHRVPAAAPRAPASAPKAPTATPKAPTAAPRAPTATPSSSKSSPPGPIKLPVPSGATKPPMLSPSNKQRLYIALYPTGREGLVNRFHWALILGPKNETGGAAGMRYHVKTIPIAPDWKYDPAELKDVRVTAQLLTRTTIGKVENVKKLDQILEKIPIKPQTWDGKADNTEPEWTCRVWLLAALKAISAHGAGVLGTNVLDHGKNIPQVMQAALQFTIDQKNAGRYSKGQDIMAPKPVLDMLNEGRIIYL